MASSRVEVNLRNDASGAARAGAVRGLRLATEHLLQASRALVPIETGALERSGRAQVDAASLTGAVDYDTVYAVRQHEDMTFRHDPGRQAKYLEQPAMTERPTIQALIAAQIRASLQS